MVAVFTHGWVFVAVSREDYASFFLAVFILDLWRAAYAPGDGQPDRRTLVNLYSTYILYGPPVVH